MTKKIKLSEYSKYMCVVSIVLVFLIFTVLSPRFLSIYSLQNLMLEIAPMLLMAGGISFVIFTGGIDLGTGAMASCTCVLTGIYVSQMGNSIILLMLVAGFIMGLLNGLIVTKLKLPSFIVTLCTMNFWACIALTQSPNGSQIIPMNKRSIVNWATANVAGVPAIFWIALVVTAFLYLVQQYTTFGRTIYAVGANTRATRIAGVDTDKAQIAAFIICGVCSALSSVFYAYKLKSAVPTVGNNLGLMAIASVALGGASMAGGRGSVLRTLIGVITITAVTSGLEMIGCDALWKDIIIGIILIVAVCLNSDAEGRDIIIK
jgi:ribose/xylose/arabinose/galactoside ABC-type transport system permease subunit